MKELRRQAYEANMLLPGYGLITLTWGNVSVFDRERGLMAIKPSGVNYADMTPDSIVVLDLEGKKVAGSFRPSSDTETHLALYRSLPGICGIAHTHSRWATVWSQAALPIPVLGTTHADHFGGEIPCTRMLTREETEGEYERAVGLVIAETFSGMDPLRVPAVLVAGHGPFLWGTSGLEAAQNAAALEEVAMMAWHTLRMRPESSLPDHMLRRHFRRKHGPGAYYGQQQE